ncbi:hypothetical protein Amet_1053 [Alkaliphilus metalliredigens QYMF]|uniref:Uncharacterized protein n=1 Tax=Alkaliphilus metalliredigens (strain QYMF) TaxID=293826 RepID=A6TM48_ALKMQ|nr:hypothetical protein [Alkaliphilus metalliredigens]ABR47266.1 hypothetical protein Amet_1053 [Alkaliphilus metalliredigens QYMF]
MFKEMTQDEMMKVDGGVKQWAIDFIKSYVLAEGINWVRDNRAEIWENFKKGPSADDPMKQTDFYKIFSTTIQ